MPNPTGSSTVQPQLSMTLITFAAEDPGSWQHMLDRARAFDRAGVDRLVGRDEPVAVAATGKPHGSLRSRVGHAGTAPRTEV